MALDPLPTAQPDSVQGAHPTPREDIPPMAKTTLPAIGPLSLSLIIISVAVAIYSNLGSNDRALAPLYISLYRSPAVPLWEVRHGQIWRLITPIFIHYGALHLIFNMIWLKDLGTVIERRHGSWFLLALVICSAIASNLAQYFVVSAGFGGMSGVVYALFGYVWLRAKSDPASGFLMPAQTVMIMLGWFVACAVGIIPGVANTAHGVGLAVGALWGAVGGRLWPSVLEPVVASRSETE